jgi:hypothetical protein
MDKLLEKVLSLNPQKRLLVPSFDGNSPQNLCMSEKSQKIQDSIIDKLSKLNSLGPIRRLSTKEANLIFEVRQTIIRLVTDSKSRVRHFSSCPISVDATNSTTFECFSDLKAHYG